jgi:uncharacterized protein with HEPN domain
MVGLRNRIAHEYFGLDISIIWFILKQELPMLKEKIEMILKEKDH